MKKWRFFRLGFSAVVFFCFATAVSLADPVAFPGAEGYGKNTVGGRGGVVYEVTNLDDSGPNSLRAAVAASGPRTVVFRVSGTIILNSDLKISNPYITIAGQTAPGDGICIRRYPLNINDDEVIIRYIRVRYGDETLTDKDAVSSRYTNNIILDHVSASWGDDETMSVYHCENITVQWCMVTETLNRGGDHGFAAIWGAPYSTYHHNLITNCVSRNPRFASGCENTDYRNNVIYNWGYNSCYGGEKQQVGDPPRNFTNINMVANYYKPGPATQSGAVSYRIANPTYRDVKTDYGKFYVADNFMVGNATVTADNWDGGVQPQGGSGDIGYVKLTEPWPSMAINQQTAEEAYSSVLENAGCSLVRDSVDTRIITEVTNGTATYGDNGIIESQTEVGGWPTLNSLPAPADNDHDGMPDAWETANGLNPNNAADRNYYDLHLDYTNLEIYLNSLVGGDATAPSAPTGFAATAGDATVWLDWNDNSEGDLMGYNIFRSTISGSGYVQLNSELLTESEYTDNDVNNTVTYYYVVNALDTSWNRSVYSSEEPATPEDVLAPAVPVGLWASIADGNVLLEWNDNSESDFDGYNVYRSMTTGSGYTTLNTSLLSSSNYTDDTTVSGNTYYYVVTALDIWSNESDDSIEASATLSDSGMGTILREYWTGIASASVNDLTFNINYPDYPAGSDLLANFEGPVNWADSYGTRISGYLHPPQTGDYVFYIAGDDNCELWLSSDAAPDNASLIAYVSGYTNPRQWDKYPEQQSSPISLTAGQKYYIETLHKDANDGDNISVAWSGPAMSQQVISGSYLSPWLAGVYGDTTGDDWVDLSDLPDFISSWLQSDCLLSSAWDLNGDCSVDFSEFSALACDWMSDVVRPDPPLNLSATHGDAAVSLNWDDNSEPDLAGYDVYRSTTPGRDYAKINGSPLTDSNVLDDTVVNGTTYYYVVRGVDTSSNESGYSNGASATPQVATTSLTIQEEEAGFCTVQGSIGNSYAGFTGTGYADTTDAYNKGIEWSIDVLSPGTYTITWRYANGAYDSRTGTLLSNGSTLVTSIQFPQTGAWTNWSTVSVNVTLSGGVNNIRLASTTLYGLANIDYMKVDGTNVETTSCP